MSALVEKKLSDEQIVEMRKRGVEQKEDPENLAKAFNVTKPYVYAVLRGSTRKKAGGPIQPPKRKKATKKRKAPARSSIDQVKMDVVLAALEFTTDDEGWYRSYGRNSWLRVTKNKDWTLVVGHNSGRHVQTEDGDAQYITGVITDLMKEQKEAAEDNYPG